MLAHAEQRTSLLALAALQLHLLRRWYETVFVMKYPRGAKMHLIAYIFGLRCVLRLACATACCTAVPQNI